MKRRIGGIFRSTIFGKSIIFSLLVLFSATFFLPAAAVGAVGAAKKQVAGAAQVVAARRF